MSTVPPPVASGNTDAPVPATWQEDYEGQHRYFVWFFRKRFRALLPSDPDQAEEQLQEALCQVAIVFQGQYKLHGKRTEDRYSIARYVFCRVKSGRSCTRPSGHNADPMDRIAFYRCTGPRRIVWRWEVAKLLREAPARRSEATDLRLDYTEWLEKLPPFEKRLAREFLTGASSAEIARRLGVCRNTVHRYRRRLAADFASYWQ
jgi:hypothetical protein